MKFNGTFRLIALAAFISFSSLSHAYAMDGIESDSGIRGPTYRELVEKFNALATRYPGIVKQTVYGMSDGGEPLIALQISGRTSTRARVESSPAILISGTIHGNEYLNIEDRLPEWFASTGQSKPEIRKFFQKGGTIYILPILNPDGYIKRQRENRKGTDLNRDFSVKQANHTAFRQIETRAIRDFVASEIAATGRKLALTLDYHCCIGAGLYPWSFKTSAKLPPKDKDRMLAAGDIMQQVFGSEFRIGTTPEILGYDAIGSTKDYYYENYGSVSFTFEGRFRVENKYFQDHTLMWEKLIEAINAGELGGPVRQRARTNERARIKPRPGLH